MTENDRQQVRDIAKIEVREYFDHYLLHILPEQMKAGRAHTHQQIAAHNLSPKSHGGVEEKVKKWGWMAAGVIALASFLGSSAFAAIKGWFGG